MFDAPFVFLKSYHVIYCVTGYEILKKMDVKGKKVMADREYDTDKIIALLEEKQANLIIPIRKHRTIQRRLFFGIMKLAI